MGSEDSTPINVLREQRDSFKSEAEKLRLKDRQRTLSDLGAAPESHESLMAVLADQAADVWDDPAAVREAAKAKGMTALFADPGQETNSPPPPGVSDAEKRLEYIHGNSTPPPSGEPTSLLEQAKAALAAGDYKTSMKLKAAHLAGESLK